MMSFSSLVALQDALHLARDVVVLLADHVRVELARGGVQRVHGRIDAQGGDVAAQHDGGVEVGKVVAGEGRSGRPRARTRPGSR